MNRIAHFEELLRRGRDDAILRFGLATEHYKCGQPAAAAEHLRQALALDPGYSAAWKLYGKTLAEQGLTDEAIQAYEQGYRPRPEPRRYSSREGNARVFEALAEGSVAGKRPLSRSYRM